MRVEIKDGKIEGWLTSKEARAKLHISETQLLNKTRNGLFSEKDHIMLYGRHYYRKTAVEKIVKNYG